MTHINWRGWLRRLLPRPAARAVRRRPRLEWLEDRTAPATFTVVSTGDTDAGSGFAGDLRYCIAKAADSDTILFDLGAGPHTITLSSQLTIDSSVTIDAGSSQVTVSGGHTVGGVNGSRVFEIDDGVTAEIDHLTIADGFAQFGGGINNAGLLTLNGCTLTGNEVFGGDGGSTTNSSGGGGGGASLGGAIYNTGALTLINCTLTANQAVGGQGGATSKLTLNGTAALNGTKLELTNGATNQAGSAFSTSPVDVTKFTSQFPFQITAGTSTADGITFTIQGVGPTALGPGGGGLGYGPDHTGGTGGIAASVALKFDLYNNQGEGVDSTGLYINGAAPTNVGSIDLTSSGLDLHSGDVFQVNLSYDGTTLTEVIKDTVTGKSATETYTINIPGTVGGTTAYVGFTGGTGELVATQDILTWTFSPNASVSPNAPSGLGGAVFNDGGTVHLLNDTIADNSAVGGAGGFNFSAGKAGQGVGGGVFNNGGTVDSLNTIIAANTAADGAPDFHGALSSQGHNLIGDTTGGSGFAATDLVNVAPGLGPLQDNGGPTQTMALTADSPAFFAGAFSGAPAADQRGVARAGWVSIGAYQADAHLVVVAPAQADEQDGSSVTVRVIDSFGDTVTSFRGTVHFASSDPRAVLPADYTFTAADAGAHAFTGVRLLTPGPQSISVTGPGLAGSAVVVVSDAAPAVNLGTAPAVVAAGTPLDFVGSFTDPDGSQWTATVDFGDGSGPQPLVLNPDKTFDLRHVYTTEGSFTAVVVVTDESGLSSSSQLLVESFIPGTDPAGVGVAKAAPGSVGVASADGITGVLYRSAAETGDGFLLVAAIPTAAAPALTVGSTGPGGAPLTASYDVRGVNLGAGDVAVVTFTFPPGGTAPQLFFFDAAAGVFRPVGAFAVDPVAHTITVVFSRDSFPQLTDLKGTVFTATAAPSPGSDAILVGSLLAAPQASSPATAGPAGGGAGGAGLNAGNSFAAAVSLLTVGTTGLGEVGGGGVSDGTEATSPRTAAAEVLNDLPSVKGDADAPALPPPTVVVTPSQAPLSGPSHDAPQPAAPDEPPENAPAPDDPLELRLSPIDAPAAWDGPAGGRMIAPWGLGVIQRPEDRVAAQDGFRPGAPPAIDLVLAAGLPPLAAAVVRPRKGGRAERAFPRPH
jgi:hypothetical protein